MKKITLFLVAIFAMNLFSFAQSQMSGTYTVGTGGTYDYASLADAGMAIKSAEFTGDVTLLICTDLTETINTGIVNKSNYTLTIRPDKDENRTITYTTAKDNTGPTGVFVIGGDMTKTPGSTIGWASIPTRNVIVDGAAAGYTTPRLKITNEVFGTNVLLYGDVQDVIIRNCILVGRSSNTAYALVFRSENYSQTSKDIAPQNCLVENCVLQSSSSSSQTVYFQGNQANSVAGWPTNITLRDCSIKARTRGMYVRQVKNLNIEGCTFDMSNSSGGILAHAIMGEGARGTINVKGNKFIKNSTANYHGGTYGLQTITASGGADVWVIENNYFAGYDALKAISNTTNGTEARLVAVRCGDYCEVRHNTFHMPNLTKDQASKLVSDSPTTLLWLAGPHKYPVQNNIFVCEETTANVSLIRGGLNENVTGNVFYHKGGNAAIVAAAPSCMIFADLETSYPTQAATSKWTNVTFTDVANGDLSLAGASDGDANLAVDRLAEVLTDIEGKTRAERTYAGAYEAGEFPAEVCTVTANANPIGGGIIEGAGVLEKGSTVTLTATPAAHYDFLNWTGDVTSTDNPLTITVNSDLTVTANFQEHTKYTITASAADNTMGYVTGGGTYYAGETVTLKATAKTGYYFTGWSDSNTENPRTFTATEDLTLQANFAKAYPRVYAYDLNVVDNGDSYTFSFKPNTDAVSGNLLLYSEDGTNVIQTHAITTAIVAHNTTTITLNKEDLPTPADIPWAIQLSGNAIPAFAETFADADYRFARAHAVVDNSPESEYFGRVYVADRRSTKSNSSVYVYNPDFTDLANTKLGLATAGYSRPAVGADGTLYLTGYTDGAEAGIFVVNPADLTKCTQFFNGTYDADGLYTNNSVEIGSSTSGVGVYGAGKDAVLYTMMEDGSNANFNSGKQPIVCYKIGQNDGTVLKQWSEAPTWWVNYPAKAADKSYNYGNNDFAATAKGVWVSQNKSNVDDRPEIAFIDNTGTIQLMQNSKKCFGGGMTVNADNTALYIVEDSKILEYSIAWNENTPSLTLSNTYPISLSYISTLSVDYAGNLIACAGTSYATTNNNVMKVVSFTLPTNDNTCTVPAAKNKTLKLGARYNVEVAVNANEMGRATGGGEYKEGATATFIATPNYGYRFLNWTYNSETSTDNPLELTIESDLNITANFEPIQYTIIALTNDENKGTVTGAGTYNYGSEVTLTAEAKPGYKLLYWSDRSTDNPRTITMTKNEAISAYFVKIYDEEPTFTIEKLWENTNVPASTNNGFQAVGWDGKIYMKDRLGAAINVYTANSSELYMNTDAFTSEDALKGDQPIAIDDAGNIIIRSGSGLFYSAPTQVTILRKGETTGKTIDFTLPAIGRCDFISASGDIYSTKGGYVYFYCMGQTKVNRVKIAEGALVSIEEIGSGLATGQSQSHVMTNIFGNIIAHTKSNNIKEIDVHTNQTVALTLPTHKLNTLGGCSFELGGKELIAYNITGTNYNSEWNLYNMTDKNFLSNETLYVKDKASTNSAANWLNVQVVDENTAYIYQFCPTVAVAVWKVSLVRNDLQEFTVTTTANNANLGSIIGAGTYYDGATAMLTATPAAGCRFVNWTKAGVEVSTDDTYLFTVTEDVELVANFELMLLDTENNEAVLTSLADQTADVAVYRSLTSGMYNTLCLPFDVATLTGTPLENTTVWQYNGATVKGEGEYKEIFLEFTEVDSIVAGQPYLVEPTEDIEAPMEFKGVTISATEGSAVEQFAAVTMQGVLHPTELQADDKSILFLVANNELAWANVTANMNGMRAYFKVNEPSLQSARTRAYIKRTPTVATGMENTEYNPQENNTRKIIYNNTIYILRGDEVYTIQGTKVK